MAWMGLAHGRVRWPVIDSSPDGADAAVRVSQDVTTLIGLSSDYDAIDLALQSIQPTDGQTWISGGLESAADILVGARADAMRVILLLTDGEQTDDFGGSEAAIATADEVKAKGNELFAVGFGTAELSTLEAMASLPIATHAFLGDNVQEVAPPCGPTVADNRDHHCLCGPYT